MKYSLIIFLLLLTSCDVLSLWQDPDTRQELIQVSPEEKLYQQALSQTSDMEEVDRLVADYRRRLVIERYIDRMIESHQVAILEEDCQRYYDQVQGNLKLTEPLIQGMLVEVPVKIPKNSPLRTSMKKVLSGSYEHIETLQDYCIDHSMICEVFVDSWRNLNSVLAVIPLNVQVPKDLRKGDFVFAGKDKDYEYHLLVLDHLKVGSTTPYQYARPSILDYLAQKARSDYRKKLIEEIEKK